jgi:adenylate cyclase
MVVQLTSIWVIVLWHFGNAPLDCTNHAEMAVKTGIECADEETDKLKKEFREKGLPDINIGSGVNTGTCIVGKYG